jgi:hypothetical protein
MGISAKEELIDFIKSLPENLSEEEIAYHIYVREEIIKAQKDGKEYTQAEAEELLKQWLI